ncbi:putative f-box domain-protein [Diplogelasinospora grovesii]|uniref:F-box domain-protein n=1 Tax=Diplogelasinospora grovesii TaxID=303347 RepID=A0AAN6S8E0_9PEZI|nr:putative f-box domain-protein [Diplogelasinospora grovesii]
MASADTNQAPAQLARTFMSLPEEVQKDIFSHCSQPELICLSLVSRHFRELAAAQLYRNFHIVFPDEDDPAFDSPIDGLAGGLETFVASKYDYAKHLRDLSLDTLSAGEKAETAYKPYLYSVSCGKFMNTLLLLALQKAKSLESFRWNIRVELSRRVYGALHEIDTLTNVHIRMQAGPSLWEAPPPIPLISSQPSTSAAPSAPPHVLAPPPAPPLVLSNGPSALFYMPTSNAPPPPPAPKPIVRSRAPRKTTVTKEPPTLSGFKKLKSLAVLDIDTLDVVTEIKSCVRNSSGTLTKLKLSFSDALGLQARKPPPDLDPEDSDADDEFQVVPAPPPGSGYPDDVSGPAKAFRAQEERKSQESVLGRIFDVEPYVVKKPQKKLREKEKDAKEDQSENPGQDFINAIKGISRKLMKDLNGTSDLSVSQQEILDTIESAARKYVASEDANKTRDGNKEVKSKSDAAPSEPTGGAEATATKPYGLSFDPSSLWGQSVFGQPSPSKTKDTQKDVSPDDIDIEGPEEQLEIEPQDPPSKDRDTPTNNEPPTSPAAPPEPSSSKSQPPLTNGAPVSPSVGKAVANLAAQKMNFEMLAQKLKSFESKAADLSGQILKLRAKDGVACIAEAEKQLATFSRNIQDIQKEMNIVTAEIEDAERQIRTLSSSSSSSSSIDADDAESQNQRIAEYMRTTRGLALQSLSIYLLPVKASVLSRAIDLRVLRRITLLNVGPQAPIWAHMLKENKESPLPLRKIFTDNVSSVFLTFVSQLEELHELFLLERDNKYKPESFAPKTTTTIDQIRRLVLRKHMPTIQRLMIKNVTDTAWDVDEKTILLICRRGKLLQELACNMGIKAIHTFMQQLAGLVSLRALHIIQLRNDDTCVWVMRETKRFLIDNMSHHPEMKLEWISIDDDDRVERIIRPADLAKNSNGETDVAASSSSSKSKGKGKGKQKVVNTSNAIFNGVFPVLPPPDSWDVAGNSTDDSESEEDHAADLQHHHQKIQTLENIHFYDVWGVRIFKKEVVTGRL